ncbi:MAG TPA: hypothetical protein VNO33_10685, partial [Kofleriaceae bacterium]|nr:hypothetical protein [Kofleriaceae bacterium]
FVDDPPANVVLVHGPGGIGKSTLLRRVAERGQEAGWTPLLVEGRDLPPVADALDDALARAHSFERPLIVLDTYERMEALGGHLRRSVLPDLPDASIVVIAGRGTPDPGWREGGWENLTVELELGPLSQGDSRSLLASQGVTDERRSAELAEWARGSPLALTLAASAARNDPDWSPAREGEPPEMVRALITQLAGGEVDAVHRDAIGGASIARVVTADMLREVLPDIDPVEALEWLRRRTFSEPLGGGLTLHELVRRAVRADLHRRDPERERELRRRIADHLYVRAAAGNTLLTVDLAELVDSDAIRAFYGWEGATRNRIDQVRDSDREQLERLLGSVGRSEWWESTRRMIDEAPERVVCARDPSDNLCGYSTAVTPATAPAVAHDDILLGPWLAHAAEHVPDGNVILWRDSFDFTGDPTSGIQGMLNMVWVLRSGLANPRRAYLPIDPGHPGAPVFSQALGGRHIEELDVHVGDGEFQCHVIDYGEGGLLGLQRSFVYMELGLPAPAPRPPVDPVAVRDALRSLAAPAELARSPLATGEGIEARAASVRALLESGAERAFGDADNERLLASVLRRGYLDPAPSHEVAADELNLSRAAYFRRLKQASERLAEYLAAAPPS